MRANSSLGIPFWSYHESICTSLPESPCTFKRSDERGPFTALALAERSSDTGPRPARGLCEAAMDEVVSPHPRDAQRSPEIPRDPQSMDHILRSVSRTQIRPDSQWQFNPPKLPSPSGKLSMVNVFPSSWSTSVELPSKTKQNSVLAMTVTPSHPCTPRKKRGKQKRDLISDVSEVGPNRFLCSRFEVPFCVCKIHEGSPSRESVTTGWECAFLKRDPQSSF